VRPAVFISILLVSVFALAAPSSAQQTREVIIDRADSLVARTADGERTQSLIGNVRVRQDETFMRADRATRFLDRGQILLTGRVEIVERGDSLRAERVLYDTRSKVGEATGNVWLTDGEVVVLAPSATYDTNFKHAVFGAGVTLVDSATTLTSQIGDYWSDERRAEFAGDVRLDDPRTIILADSITYLRNEEVSVGRGSVAITHLDESDENDETPARTHLFGEWAFNDNRLGVSRIRGDPLVVQVRFDSTGVPSDTLIMRAFELEALRTDSLERMIGTTDVRIWQSRLAALGDSLVFERFLGEDSQLLSEEARMFGRPLAWMDEMQMSGDTIRITSRDSAIDSLFVRSSSFVAQWDSTIAQIHQIKGRDLLAIFRQDTLRWMRTGPQAHALYFLTTEEDEIRGGVRATGDEITFEFVGGELNTVKIISGTEGEYFPADILPEPFQLDGLQWRPLDRPTRDGLLDGRQIQSVELAPPTAGISRPTDSLP
jgi:lipopolysaccharide export system protein LptA